MEGCSPEIVIFGMSVSGLYMCMYVCVGSVGAKGMGEAHLHDLSTLSSPNYPEK